MEQGYGQLFRYLGQMPHQSCLVLTSREQPKGLATLEGETLPVRSLKLTGLPLAEGRKIFQQQGTYTGSEFEWQSVLSHYAGNPLALKMVATAIQELFESSLAKFIERLKQGTFVFSDLSDWIEEKLHLQPLPVHRLADYEVLSVCVTSHSTITVRCLLYSVPAQLIGQRLTVHLYQDRLLGFLGNQQVVELTRIYTPTDSNKRRAQSVNYRAAAVAEFCLDLQLNRAGLTGSFCQLYVNSNNNKVTPAGSNAISKRQDYLGVSLLLALISPAVPVSMRHKS